ncbi:hypothetical protein, partial [Aquipuribacter nitratireducens]|uniref:hypothetical protein n=1 Tax=Aquipuribacter nitratireducens TaxID=650104 RepID=UPI0030ED3632
RPWQAAGHAALALAAGAGHVGSVVPAQARAGRTGDAGDARRATLAGLAALVALQGGLLAGLGRPVQAGAVVAFGRLGGRLRRWGSAT